MGRSKRPLRERLYSRVVRSESGCLEWRGAIKDNGYGAIGSGTKSGVLLAHRAAWLVEYGELPPSNIDVCHKCDNRACVDVRHLFLGTRKQNMEDMVAKGRYVKRNPEHNPRNKLTWEKAASIRSRYCVKFTRTGGRFRSNKRELAEEYGVSEFTIWLVTSGRSWAE